MIHDTSLLDAVRKELEDPLIVNNLLVEMAATGGTVIPRLLVFRPRPDNSGWKIRLCSMGEPPSLATVKLSREAAIEELLAEDDEPEGIACIVYSSELERAKPGVQRSAVILEWLDLRGNRKTVLVRASEKGATYSTNSVTGDLVEAYAKPMTEEEQKDAQLGALSSAVLSKMTDALQPLLRAMAPDAVDDDAAYEKLKENPPVWSAIRRFSAHALEIALRLGAIRADNVLATMSMTISYLRAQLYQQAEEHKEALVKAKSDQTRTMTKTLAKLQRELEMTKRRAETLARQAQDARAEVRILRESRGEQKRDLPEPAPLAVMPATPLQRRMTAYLRHFDQFATE